MSNQFRPVSNEDLFNALIRVEALGNTILKRLELNSKSSDEMIQNTKFYNQKLVEIEDFENAKRKTKDIA
jgi:hypothetical protein